MDISGSKERRTKGKGERERKAGGGEKREPGERRLGDAQRGGGQRGDRGVAGCGFLPTSDAATSSGAPTTSQALCIKVTQLLPSKKLIFYLVPWHPALQQKTES